VTSGSKGENNKNKQTNKKKKNNKNKNPTRGQKIMTYNFMFASAKQAYSDVKSSKLSSFFVSI